MRHRIASFRPVTAADAFDDEEDNIMLDNTEGLQDAVEDVSDTLDDIQDAVDEVDEGPHDTIMDVHNNIENHYIAECERCHEVFISAVEESDSEISSIEGECPCCHEQTKQDLKWIIRDINYQNER